MRGAPAFDTLIAHRGESVDAPENTLPAYRTAVERGFGFECDIYLSKDGRVFTFHDRNLKRTTGGANTNNCTDVTWDVVSRLDVGSWGKWKGSKFSGTRPALLEEVLELARDGRWLYVEVKSRSTDIVPYIRDVFLKQSNATPANTLFLSGGAVAKELKAQLPGYKVLYCVNCRRGWKRRSPPIPVEEIIAGAKDGDCDGIDIRFDREVTTAAFAKAVKDAGLEFHVWTVDRLDDALEAFRRGAQTVTSNCPQKLLDEYRVARPASAAPDPQSVFKNPPKEAHAGVFWHWMGSQVTREGIEKDLDWFVRMGITTAYIFGIADTTAPWAMRFANVPTGGLRPYTDEWWRLVKFACVEGRKRGIDIGIHNCPGYTSTGGRWIPPRLAMRELVFGVNDPEKDISTEPNAAYPVRNEDTGTFEKPACLARRSDYQPIAVVRGIAVGHILMGSYVQPADWDSFGFECDKMNQEAVSFHIDHVIAELKRHLGPDLPAAGLTHMLLDSYEAGLPTWTPNMREEFKARRGYDCLDFLPILGGYTNLYTAAECEKFRKDFDRTVRDLYRDVLFRIMHEKISAEGLKFACEPYTGPFSSEEVAPHIDRIMTEFWYRPGSGPNKGLKSRRNFNTFAAPGGVRHNIVEAEAFTSAAPWDETPGSLKSCGDTAWLFGVNRFILHSCVLQPWGDDVKPGVTMGRWGSHFGRNQTWAESGRAWFDYIARSQALLQWGEPSEARLDVPFKQFARADGERTVYFLVNDSDEEKPLVLPNDGMWFDPVTGEIGAPPATLAPHQSGFWVADASRRDAGAQREIIRQDSQDSPLFCQSYESCLRIQIENWTPALGDWTKSVDAETRYFSGTKTYQATFDIPKLCASASLREKNPSAAIDLGTVLGATAQVRLNGRDLGVVWCAPWRVKIPAGVLKATGNEIEIDVTNTWRNRLVGDEREPPDVDFVKAPYPGGDMMLAYPEWFEAGVAARPSKGRKCFTTWGYFTAESELVPSGLLGPVRIEACCLP